MYAFPSKRESSVSSERKTSNESKIAPVQMSFSESRSAMSNNAKATQKTAAAGVRGTGYRLPHLDIIQKAFGEHDLSQVQAYTGTNATKANTALGVHAYATGNKIAFAIARPSLRTVAHEVVHVLQQAMGVHLKNGVGQAGDRYEQEADKIANQVVQGQAVQLAYSPKLTPDGTNIQFLKRKRDEEKDPTNPDVNERSRMRRKNEARTNDSSAEVAKETQEGQRPLKKLREEQQQESVDSLYEQSFSNVADQRELQKDVESSTLYNRRRQRYLNKREIKNPSTIRISVIDMEQAARDETGRKRIEPFRELPKNVGGLTSNSRVAYRNKGEVKNPFAIRMPVIDLERAARDETGRNRINPFIRELSKNVGSSTSNSSQVAYRNKGEAKTPSTIRMPVIDPEQVARAETQGKGINPFIRELSKNVGSSTSNSSQVAYRNKGEVKTPSAIRIPVIDLEQAAEAETEEDRISSSVIEGIESLKRGRVFYLNKESHRLYLGSYEPDGPLELMMQSFPQPFLRFIIFLENVRAKELSIFIKSANAEENKDKVEKARKENSVIQELTEADKTSRVELQRPVNSKNNNYNDASIRILQDFLDKAASLIPQLTDSVTAFHQLRGKNNYGFNYSVPKTTELSECYFEFQNFTIHNEPYQLAAGINVPILSVLGPPGSVANGPNDGTRGHALRNKIGPKDKGKDDQNQRYSEGHLLNHWLHGPGNDWKNLALIPYTTNLDTAKEAEEWAKDRVLTKNHVISYRVDVKYGRQGIKGFYEQFLPQSLKYHLRKKQPKPNSGVSIENPDAWEDTTSASDKFERTYLCKIEEDKQLLTPIEDGNQDPLNEEHKTLINNTVNNVKGLESGVVTLVCQMIPHLVQEFNQFQNGHEVIFEAIRFSSDKKRTYKYINSLQNQDKKIKQYVDAATVINTTIDNINTYISSIIPADDHSSADVGPNSTSRGSLSKNPESEETRLNSNNENFAFSRRERMPTVDEHENNNEGGSVPSPEYNPQDAGTSTSGSSSIRVDLKIIIESHRSGLVDYLASHNIEALKQEIDLISRNETEQGINKDDSGSNMHRLISLLSGLKGLQTQVSDKIRILLDYCSVVALSK
jgi:Domain of unknown function (DUF4157)